MPTIPDNYLDLFTKKSFAHVATIMANGSPQVTPVWIDYDGTHILINTARGRTKDRNMQQDARVAIEISDPDDPYRYIQIRGRVAEITSDGAEEHINTLSHKYRGTDYSYTPGQVRVIYKIAPDKLDLH